MRPFDSAQGWFKHFHVLAFGSDMKKYSILIIQFTFQRSLTVPVHSCDFSAPLEVVYAPLRLRSGLVQTFSRPRLWLGHEKIFDTHYSVHISTLVESSSPLMRLLGSARSRLCAPSTPLRVGSNIFTSSPLART